MVSPSENEIGLTAAEIAAVRRPLPEASLLPARVYADPHIFQLERERIFAKGWIPVCHISQLAQPRSYVTRHLVGEAIIAVRGRDGEVRVMSNVCRHRNTTLLRGCGTVQGTRIICPYHGWAYGLDGQLLTAPHMDQVSHFVKEDIRLPQFRSEIWHGFLFVNLDGNAPSLGAQIAGIEPAIAPYQFETMEAVEIRRRTVPWNWKVSLENFSEAYHQPLVHAKTVDHEFPAHMAEYCDVTGPYGLFWIYQRNREVVPTFFPPAAGMPEEFLRRVTVFNIYPVMHALTDAATPLVLDFNVKSPTEHELVWTVLTPEGTLTSPDVAQKIEQFKSFIEPILTEDIGVCTGVGEGVQSRFVEPGRLSHMEKTIHQFHNWWLDRMLLGSDERRKL
jgi:phenylpropionate dioxygenase-like ring-hydroxylating dioxygenase large terminal subunit